MLSFGPDEVGLADRSPCAGIRADLKMCLLSSDCCKKVSVFKPSSTWRKAERGLCLAVGSYRLNRIVFKPLS